MPLYYGIHEKFISNTLEMNIAFKFLLTFFSCFLITSCSGQSYKDFYESPLKKKNLVLEKVDELVLHNSPEEDEHKIGRLRFSFVANWNYSLFAFYDELKRQFIITDDEGAIRTVLAGKGKGPGEIVRAGGFNFDEESRLVVFDEGQRRFTVFDLTGKVIRNMEIEENDYFAGGRWLYVHENRLYTDILDKAVLGNPEEAWKSPLAGVYNLDGELVDTVGRYDPSVRESKKYLIFPVMEVDFEKGLLASVQFSGYRIQIYDLTTKERVAWFGRKTTHFKEPEEYISPRLPRHEINEKSVGTSSVAGVYFLSDYVILYFENLTDSFFETSDFNEKEPYMVVYNRGTHECYGEIALPYILGNISDDRLYSIENDNPENYTIGIYELKESG